MQPNREKLIRLIREDFPQAEVYEAGSGVQANDYIPKPYDPARIRQILSQYEQVLSGELERFNPQMTALRKEIFKWIRYYTQLDDMVCEFQENENALFSDSELLEGSESDNRAAVDFSTAASVCHKLPISCFT